MSLVMEHNDDCIWRTKNKVNHLGDPDLGECSCKCHKVSSWVKQTVMIQDSQSHYRLPLQHHYLSCLIVWLFVSGSARFLLQTGQARVTEYFGIYAAPQSRHTFNSLMSGTINQRYSN